MDVGEPGWAVRHRNSAGVLDVDSIPADAAIVHATARRWAADMGGATEVLRSSDDGWIVVAAYTDQAFVENAR